MKLRPILLGMLSLVGLSANAGDAGAGAISSHGPAGAASSRKNCITVLDPATGQRRQECKGLDLGALKQSKGGKPQFTRAGDCP